MEENITITKRLYLALKIRSERLNRLERHGVDKWDHYGDALNPDDEPDMEEFEEKETSRMEAL